MKKIKNYLWGILIIALLLSCKNARVIEIPVQTEPVIKSEQGATLAVIPLFGDDHYIDAVNRATEDVIDIIEDNTSFLVLDSNEVEILMESTDLDTLKAFSKLYALEIGEELRSKYVLFGKLLFDATEYHNLEYAPNVRYGAEQEYAPYIDEGPRFSTYDLDIEMRYTLTIYLKVVCVETREIVMDESFSDYSEYLVRRSSFPLDGEQLNSIFSELLYNVINDFKEQLHVHDVEEERYVFTK